LPDRTTPRRLSAAKLRLAFGAVALTSCCLLGGTAQATPIAPVGCRGGLTKGAATANDPNLTNYSFNCSGDIESYTLVVNRTPNDLSTFDDFNTAPSVYNFALTTISPTETVDCQATTTPGDGINCFAQSSANPQTITAYNWIQGYIDTTDPFCGGVPKGAKAGTAAEPAAVVQLVVTDTTGAEWGPFPLSRSPACPKLKLAKPAKKTKKKKK
jgi:hypothetical protein